MLYVARRATIYAMSKPPLMPTRFRLEECLAERGMTQSELARRSLVSFQTVNAICRNRTTRVDLATLSALARVLDVEPGDLLERDKKRGRSK